MIYPGYQLNPGDMFSVEPDRVLYATGAPKDARERRNSRRFRAALKKSKPLPTDAEPSVEPAETSPSAPEEASTPDLPTSDPKETLKTLVARAKTLLSNPPTALPAKRKQDIRAFLKLVKQNLSRPTILSDSLEAQFLELTSRLTNPSSPSSSSSPDSPPSPETPAPAAEPPAALSAVDRILLHNALAEARENPIDASKSYATPWRPRPYMSAFAFVPRYLEVHHRICSAVYVRHPVARPGLAEVPTPYGSETNSLAYLWYLRRR